mgnify:CR=1 FL=1
MWEILHMQQQFKGILRNPLYNNLNFPVKINVKSGVILKVRHKKKRRFLCRQF